MLNRELEVTLNLAFKEARARRHEFMTVEHLLLALLDNDCLLYTSPSPRDLSTSRMPSSA